MRTHGVLTHSRRSVLTECPWKEWVSYELRLRPWTPAVPLWFGSLWHEIMAAVYQIHAWWETAPYGPNEPELTPEEVADTILGVLVHEIQPTWRPLVPDLLDPGPREVIPAGGLIADWKRRQFGNLKPDGSMVRVPEEVDGAADLAVGMLRGYLRRWWTHDRTRYRVLAVEHMMERPILGPKRFPSWRWTYRGDTDLALQERATGDVYVGEHKHTSGEPEAMFDELRVSPQGEGYSWLWEGTRGVRPKGILYRVTRKHLPAAPKRNKCPGTVKEHGVRMVPAPGGKKVKDHSACALCKGSDLGPVSEALCDTTADLYRAALETARGEGFEPSDKHHEILADLETKGPRAWYNEKTRWFKPDDPDPFRRFVEETHRLTQAKARMLADGERGHWRADNSRACMAFSRPCAFMALCELNASNTLERWREDSTLRDIYRQIPEEERLF